MDKITVIIPVYNKGKYLHGLLNSLLIQSYRNFECIIIDDGSKDESGKICDNYAAKDFRIKVFHIENGGVSRARNLGIQKASGTYITFVDGDDEIAPDYLLHLYECMTKNNVDLVISGLAPFGGSRNQREILHPMAPVKLPLAQLLPNFAEVQQDTGIYGYCVAKMFPRRLVDDVRFDPDLKLAEDFDFYLRLYRKVQSVFLDDHTDYHYRQEADFSWMLLQDDQIDYVSQLRINLRYRDFLASQNAYTGDNRQIVEQKINNYLYFSLYHCPQGQLGGRFAELYRICAESNVVPQGEHGMQKLCLDFLRKNQPAGVKAVLGAYRSARVVRNSLRKK